MCEGNANKALANGKKGKGRGRSASKSAGRSRSANPATNESIERKAMKDLEQLHGPDWAPCKDYRDRQIEEARDCRRDGSPETRLKKSREFIERKRKELDK